MNGNKYQKSISSKFILYKRLCGRQIYIHIYSFKMYFHVSTPTMALQQNRILVV